MDYIEEIIPDALSCLSISDRQLYYDTIGNNGVWNYLESRGVALKGHFVFTGGGHGDVYINIRDLNTVQLLSPVAMQIAWEARKFEFDAIVGTPHGADTLTVLIAYYYTQFTMKKIEILKPLKKSDELVWYKDHGERVKGLRILQIEDLINTAKSLRETATFISDSGGRQVGFIAVCNRISDKNPGLKALQKELVVEYAHVLTDVVAANYIVDIANDPRKQCPGCAEGKKLNMRVGHGKKFLESIEKTYPLLYKSLTDNQ
jgi:orotate phosphoribosyltransferase